MLIHLPISKSIANRLLLIAKMRGDDLQYMFDETSTPEDVIVLRDILANDSASVADCRDSGTAMRFLTAYFAQAEGRIVQIIGSERLSERPISQLVDALKACGADIRYNEREGHLPLTVYGKSLRRQKVSIPSPQSTQFVSALLLAGMEVETDIRSPYIYMTQEMLSKPTGVNACLAIEPDWSAAAFWYERCAIRGEEYFFPGLSFNSLQGDKAVADIFALLGVETKQIEGGICIQSTNKGHLTTQTLSVDFASCPDLYPAVYATCSRLGISMDFTGLESLPLKESDRLSAMRQIDNLQNSTCGIQLKSFSDHRIAMALLAAGYEVDNTDCIRKSYPMFMEQLRSCRLTVIVPIRHGGPMPDKHKFPEGTLFVDDENKGKKYALHKGVITALTEYVWLRDADTADGYGLGNPDILDADMYILPLEMSNGNGSLLCRMQKVEYEAIQNLTVESAKRGHAVMCSGANLIVKRSSWLDSFNDLHIDLPSGDDMFLLESFKRRGLHIDMLDNDRLSAVIAPEEKLHSFLKQRMRWAGKAPHYTDKDIIRCGILVALLNFACIICPLIYIPKYLIERRFISEDSLPAVLLSLLYPFYMIVCLIGGLFRKHLW